MASRLGPVKAGQIGRFGGVFKFGCSPDGVTGVLQGQQKESVMRKILKVTGLVLASALAPGVAAAATTCIDTRDIKELHEVDGGKALLFTMKNGTTYRNNLAGPCPGLVFDGYVWVVRNPDNSVCDGTTSIRVLRSGEICQIGNFEKVAPAQSRAPG